MKGIILAGGKATRLYPVTKVVCKQLLPVYDKPLIYYSLSILMLAGIKDILVISTPHDTPRFKELLADGKTLGINISYAVQDQPQGIAQSFIIGENFVGNDNVCLILGDNIFYGDKLTEKLQQAASLKKGATIFGYYVKDPCRYGVIGFEKNNKVVSIEEKPKISKSNWVVTGLYFYDNEVIKIAKGIKPSKRGELEITCINNEYLKKGRLKVELLGRGFAWLDTGTADSLIEASMFIKAIEDRQGLKVGCIDEIAYRMGYINSSQLEKTANSMVTGYGEYLRGILKNE